MDNPTAKAVSITVSFPAKLIFFISQSAADAYMTKQGGGADISNTTLNAAGNATTGIPNALAGGGIGSLFQAGIWTRVGEVAIGLMLMYVGLKAMVTPGSVGSVASQTFGQTVKHARRVVKG